MKRKYVVGLIAILATVAMVMFTGCVEKEAPAPLPTPIATEELPVATQTPQYSPAGFGLGGECICPNCGYTMPHKRGVPCAERTCPECGAQMIRQD